MMWQPVSVPPVPPKKLFVVTKGVLITRTMRHVMDTWHITELGSALTGNRFDIIMAPFMVPYSAQDSQAVRDAGAMWLKKLQCKLYKDGELIWY